MERLPAVLGEQAVFVLPESAIVGAYTVLAFIVKLRLAL